MSKVIEEGRLIKVEVDIRLPVAATLDDIETWIDYALLQRGGIGPENPLMNHGAEPFGEPMLTDTLTNGRREEYGHQKTETGTRYKVRYVRTPA